MTHILIKISDIEDRIIELQKNRQESAKDRTEHGKLQFLRWSGKIAELKYFLTSGKQISLDEKDIEERAINSHPVPKKIGNRGVQYSTFLGKNPHKGLKKWKQAYKQALKDLI